MALAKAPFGGPLGEKKGVREFLPNWAKYIFTAFQIEHALGPHINMLMWGPITLTCSFQEWNM